MTSLFGKIPKETIELIVHLLELGLSGFAGRGRLFGLRRGSRRGRGGRRGGSGEFVEESIYILLLFLGRWLLHLL
jgi:hypothetical protein